MNLQFTKTMLAGAALLAFAAPSAWANHIDFFDAGPFNLSGPGSVNVTGIPTGSTLGGERFVRLESSGAGTLTASLTAPFAPGNDDDAMMFTAGPGTMGVLTIGIGRSTNLNANFLDIPMSTLDWDRVRLQFGSGTVASTMTNVMVTLFSNGQGTSAVSKTYSGGAGNLDFLHTEFFAMNSAFTASTLRDIDSAAFSISTGADGGTYQIASFNRNGAVDPIPEPGTFVLLGLGAAGMFLYGRFRKSTV